MDTLSSDHLPITISMTHAADMGSSERKLYKICCRNQTAETHEKMKLANRNCNKITARAKKDCWLALSDSVSAGKTDLGSVWKKI